MAINIDPVFTRIPNCPAAVLAAANTAGDGSGTLVLLFTASADNSLLLRIIATAGQATVGASAAKVIRIFMTDASGLNPIKIAELALPGATGNASTIGATATYTWPDGGLPLKAGQLIKIAQSVYASAADQTHVFAVGADYTI
jgi:hypothetical protein